MSEPAKWRGASAEAYQAWRRAFNEDWSGPDLEAPCPVCSSRTLHRWYIQESTDSRVFEGVPFKGHGRLWEWCSTCQTCEYLPDGFVPEWWKAPFTVEPHVLRSDPGPIEEARRAAP